MTGINTILNCMQVSFVPETHLFFKNELYILGLSNQTFCAVYTSELASCTLSSHWCACYVVMSANIKYPVHHVWTVSEELTSVERFLLIQLVRVTKLLAFM